jgi:hypothetical protein
MTTRVAVVAAPFNQGGTTVATFAPYVSAGVDAVGAGGTTFGTSWPGGGGGGVVIPNQGNGAVWLYWVSGAAGAGITQVLVGQQAASTGQVLPATTEQMTLPATSSGWLGPWSPATYNQSAPTVVTYTGLINATALTLAAQGCVVIDFTTVTNLCVRAYQNTVVSP